MEWRARCSKGPEDGQRLFGPGKSLRPDAIIVQNFEFVSDIVKASRQVCNVYAKLDVDKIGKTVDEVKSAVEENGIGKIKDLMKSLEKAVNAVKKTFGGRELGEAAGDGLLRSLDLGMDDVLDAAERGRRRKGGGGGGAVKKTVKSTKKAVKKAKVVPKAVAKPVVQAVMKTTKVVAKTATKTTKVVAKTATATANTVAKTTVEAANTVAKTATKAATSLGKMATGGFDSVFSKIKEALGILEKMEKVFLVPVKLLIDFGGKALSLVKLVINYFKKVCWYVGLMGDNLKIMSGGGPDPSTNFTSGSQHDLESGLFAIFVKSRGCKARLDFKTLFCKTCDCRDANGNKRLVEATMTATLVKQGKRVCFMDADGKVKKGPNGRALCHWEGPSLMADNKKDTCEAWMVAMDYLGTAIQKWAVLVTVAKLYGKSDNGLNCMGVKDGDPFPSKTEFQNRDGERERVETSEDQSTGMCKLDTTEHAQGYNVQAKEQEDQCCKKLSGFEQKSKGGCSME